MLYDKNIQEPLFDFLEEMCGKIRILEEKTMTSFMTGIMWRPAPPTPCTSKNMPRNGVESSPWSWCPELAHIQELNEMPKYKEKSPWKPCRKAFSPSTHRMSGWL